MDDVLFGSLTFQNPITRLYLHVALHVNVALKVEIHVVVNLRQFKIFCIYFVCLH